MSKRKKQRSIDDNPVVQELADIKRLLILQLLTSGVLSTHVARTLQVDNSVISRMVPARMIRKLRRQG